MSTSNLSSVDSENLIGFFAQGVIAALDAWPALSVAVKDQWAGDNSGPVRVWLISTIVSEFDARQPSKSIARDVGGLIVPEVEKILHDAFSDEFGCDLDDDDLPKVAQSVVDLWVDLQAGHLTVLHELQRKEQVASRIVHSSKRDQSDGEDDDDGEDEDENDESEDEDHDMESELKPAKLRPTTDDDGWTTLPVRRKK